MTIAKSPAPIEPPPHPRTRRPDGRSEVEPLSDSLTRGAAGSEAEELAWAGEKREFVADSRDDAADEREHVADARDLIADVREAAADVRDARLNEGAKQLQAAASEAGLSRVVIPTARGRDLGRAARESAREERGDVGHVRKTSAVRRDAATLRRKTDDRPTLLALAFARIAEELYHADTYDEVLMRIATAAVATVTGGQSATVTLLEAGTYRTAGSTDPSATAVDQAQYDAGEGPTIDALTMPVVDARSFPDERWPILGTDPADLGVQSSLSYKLETSSREGTERAASLNIYALTPDAFDPAAHDIGAILAAHASLAARAVGERTTLEALDHHLEQALLSRDVIGQAKGILMERLKATPEEAFDILKRSSQRLNLKLREVARALSDTGEMNPTESRRTEVSP